MLIFNFSITSILLSRFILDLRSVYNCALDPSSPSSNITTVRFAAAVEGNIGASLDDSWATGRNSDSTSMSDVQFSDSPFATGLITPEEDEKIQMNHTHR